MAVRVLGERAKSLVLENRRLTEQNQAALLSAGLRLGDIELAYHLAKGQIHQDEGGTNKTACVSASNVTARLINDYEPVDYQRNVHSADSAPHNAFSISLEGHSNALSDTTYSEQRSSDEQVGASILRVKPRPIPGVPRCTAEMSVRGDRNGNDEMGVGGTIHPQVGVIDSAVSSSVFSGSPRVLSVRSVPSHNSDGANISMENSDAEGSGALWQRGKVCEHEGCDLHTTLRQFHNGIERQGAGSRHQEHKWLVEVAKQLVIPAPCHRKDGTVSHRPGAGVEETTRGDSFEIISQSLSTQRSSRVHWRGSQSRTPLLGTGSENEVPNPADTIRVDEQVRRPRSLGDAESPKLMKVSSSRVRSKLGGEASRKLQGDVW